MFKFQEFINENKSYFFSFIYDNKKVEFKNLTIRKNYENIINWLSKNTLGLEVIKNKIEILTYDEVIKSIEQNPGYRKDHFFKISDTNLYTRSNAGFKQLMNTASNLLQSFGIDKNTIEYKYEDNSTPVEEPNQKMHPLIKAAQIILQENDNQPMSANEIWDIIEDRDLVEIKKPTSSKELDGRMMLYSESDKISDRIKLFTVVDTNPRKFILSNPDKVQDFSEERESSKLDIQTKGPLDANSSERKENPFRQCICILGDPGVGKSVTTIETIGNDDNHKFYLSIPTDLSTSMLVQFVRGELVLNKISKMIVEAYKNPNIKYTVLIDEFHKPLTIKRVNDELLQAISTKRYREHRFISSEIAESFISQELDKLGFTEKQYSYHGNIEIPRNFGFILLSSKPNVILDNEDLYDRMDIIYLRKKDKDTINNIKDLKLRIIHKEEDKKSFKKLIKSEDKEMDDDVWRESLNNFLDNISREPIKESFSPIIKFTDWRIL